MSRYIDADALYEKTAEWEAQALHMCEVTMQDEDKTEWKRWSTILTERSAFKFDIADFPTADVKPVVRGENLGGGAFLCSVCGFDDVAHSHTVKFCPNCGAEIINARPADEDDSGLQK